ncbi:MAG: NAD(P)-binding protein [Phycisphaeraceae bacterium]
MSELSPISGQPPVTCRRIIVAGYGPVGRCVAEQFRSVGVHVTIVDTNPNTIHTQTKLGHTAVQGDVTDPHVLTAAGIEEADALILAIPNEDLAVKACQEARRLSPRIFIAARTNFVSRGLLATKAGADHVTIEELVTAEAMGSAVMRHFFDGTAKM